VRERDLSARDRDEAAGPDAGRRLSRRLDDFEGDLLRLQPGGGDPAPSGFGYTTPVASYPADARAYYGVQVVELIDGPEVEGAVPAITVGATVLMANLGGAVPDPGTLVGFDLVGDRWAFIYNG
jgi:hypothetical protein